MKQGFLRLIRDYQRCVERAVGLLEASGIARPRSNSEWASSDVPGRGSLPDGSKYYKHAFGCAVAGRDWSVEFDFGAHGEIDGFSADRLHYFAGSKLTSYGFTSRDEVERAVADAAAAGTLQRTTADLYYIPEETPLPVPR